MKMDKGGRVVQKTGIRDEKDGPVLGRGGLELRKVKGERCEGDKWKKLR